MLIKAFLLLSRETKGILFRERTQNRIVNPQLMMSALDEPRTVYNQRPVPSVFICSRDYQRKREGKVLRVLPSGRWVPRNQG